MAGVIGSSGPRSNACPSAAAGIISSAIPLVTGVLAAVGFALCGTPAMASADHPELDLAGEWRFKVDEADVGVDEAWFDRRLDQTISLPGSMPEQRRGRPVDADTQFTGNMWKEYPEGQSWLDDPNYKPFLRDDEFRFPFWLISDYHYVGPAWYQTRVRIPADWQGADVEFFLERPHWETTVWVNGEPMGRQDGLGVPHRYRVGDALDVGSNTITIRVDNRVKEIEVGLDAHSISDNTQSNWNGIVGDIKLVRRSPVSVGTIAIFPDVADRSARLEVSLSNITNEPHAGGLTVSARPIHPEPGDPIQPVRLDVTASPGDSIVTLYYPLDDDAKLWDEFDPNLYEVSVELETEHGLDTHAAAFGLREITSRDMSLWINDRPLYLRGTLECAIFPKTGYPPTTAEPWENLIRVAKEHGLNHIRFHSWCPPKVAFEVADRMGFYYQVEASTWAGDIGSGRPVDQWVYEEAERMVREYGNHPSFALMPYGNEPHGPNHREFLIEFVEHWKAKDNRRVYTTGAGWPITDANEFHNIYHGTRIQGWNANLSSIINSQPPRSDYDWTPKVSELSAPVVSHEVGQWCVYANFDEIPKYDGVLKATNFKIFRDSLDARGLLHLADDFVRASGRLQALCYKADIEAALRTPGFSGFQLLDIRDFTGQGTALVGILDPFWDEKGYISPEEFRQFSNETVPLARLPKHIYTSEESIECVIEVAHYGREELESVTPTWQITNTAGETVREGSLETTRVAWGNAQVLGSISESFPVTEATQLELRVNIAGFVNTWDFWVYPSELPTVGEDIHIARTLDDEAARVLEDGGSVLLTIEKGAIRHGMGGEVGVGFSSMFWNTAWTNGQLPHTLGILTDPAHPALAHFPTEYHSNWQWWDAMSNSNAISLDSFEPPLDAAPEPIVRIIDDWVTNKNLGLLFELRVGNGTLLFAGVDLVSNLENRAEARQLLHSLMAYMESVDFSPQTEASVESVRSLFEGPAERLKETARATASSAESGYAAQQLLDGRYNTLWHTEWRSNRPGYPHTVTIDLMSEVELAGVVLTPRQDGNRNGVIASYEVSLSSTTGGDPAATTTVDARRGARQHTARFDRPSKGRYLTIVATKGFGDDTLASLAEVDLLLQ